jgi:hypothetical protein
MAILRWGEPAAMVMLAGGVPRAARLLAIATAIAATKSTQAPAGAAVRA